MLVQEKLDGSCVCAARLGDEVLALGRGGDRAALSRNPARRMWAAWVARQKQRFLRALRPGERLVGEWLALAHGTRYALSHEPFVAFDLMAGFDRAPWDVLLSRAALGGFTTAALIHRGGPLPVAEALLRLGPGRHGALDPVEGAVWRVERHGAVDLIAKYVRPDKQDGWLLPENSGQPAVWNFYDAGDGHDELA